MTISTTTTLNRYTGNSATTVFPYSFRILAATDLVVTKRAASTLVETTLAYPADYSVSGVGNATGGSVMLAVAPATGDLLVIERDTSRTQGTSIRNQGSYFPETHENVFDKLTMMAQEDEVALGRTFSLPKTLDPANYNMELPVPTAGQVLTWSTNGLTNGSVSTSSVVLPGQGRDTTTLTQYLANNYVFNPFDYEAQGDGKTDDSAAIQAAITAIVAAGGGVLYLPISVGGFGITSALTFSDAVPIIVSGPGKIVLTTDITTFLITGSKITFDQVRVERTPAAGTQAVYTVSGGSEIQILHPTILGAPLYGIYCNGASKVKILEPYIYRSYDHGIYVRDGCDDIEIIGGRIIEPGYTNASSAAGKGIGVQGISTLCTNIRIHGVTVIDPNQIGIELFGNSGVTPGVQFFSVTGCIVRQSKGANGSRFGVSLDGALDGCVQGCVVSGSELAFEIAGGCKRAMYDGNVSLNSLGEGVQVSNSAASPANDADQIVIANQIVKSAATHGIEVVKAKTVTLANPQVDLAGNRGIFLNDPGATSRITLANGIVTNCVKTGVYVLTTAYVDWIIRGVQARGNNTAVAANEDVGFYVNSDTQAHQNSIAFQGLMGSMANVNNLNARSSALSLSASATTSLGLKWRYRIGEKWRAVYRLPVQVTAGVAGLTFDLAAVPTTATGRLTLTGNTSGVTATATDTTTTLTTPSSTAFMTASFIGFVEIRLFLSGGTVDGDIDLQVITGASAAGSIFAGASVELVRV